MSKAMKKLIFFMLKVIGATLILIGLVGAYYGPLEIWVFYFFSKGGQFYYEGFGIGSFWFGALVIQNLGYYIVAAICIPLGIGHWKLRRWTLTLTQLYLWFWLGAGLLLGFNLLLFVPSALSLNLSREVLLMRLSITAIFAFFCLILLPILGLWFYQRPQVRAIFQEHDSKMQSYWLEHYPFPLLTLLLLYAIMIIVLHIAIFFQSLLPIFGQISVGRQGVYIVSLCILVLGILIYGTVKQKRWAWWGALIYLLVLSISSLLSFSRYNFYELALMMKLPAYEMEILDKMALIQDFNLTVLITGPLLTALGLLIYSKKHFRA